MARSQASERRRQRPSRPLWALLALCAVAAPLIRGLAALVLAPGKYRTLTRIRLRQHPNVASQLTGDRLEKGEVFEAVEIVPAPSPEGLGYLRVGGREGWVFDRGIAGAWVGKEILEGVEEAPPSAEGVAAPAAAAEPVAAAPAEAATAESVEPAVAIGMAQVEMMRLPGNMLGAGFELLRLEVKGARQPLVMLLSTAFPAVALTSAGRDMLPSVGAAEFKGGWLSQAAKSVNKVDLEGVRLAGSGAAIDDIKGCEVLDFPQAQLLEQLGVQVHGVLGQPWFELYDVDVDRYGQRASLYGPGQAAAQGFYSTMRHLPGIALPSGNLGVVLRGTGVLEDQEREVSIMGLVDTGAAHTVLNWEAAKLLGYSGPEDPVLKAATKVLGAGERGQPVEMPVVLAKFSLCSVPQGVKPMMLSVSQEDFKAGDSKGWYFEEQTLRGGSGKLELGAVNVAVGDVLGLSVLRDSMIGPFKGAAAIIGQDLLFQAQRVVINLRDKQLWLEPGDVRDAEEM